jgi:AcrR family transcriptional regulator
MTETKPDARIAGLANFTMNRREANLGRLREAAEKIFGDRGYLAPAVEDIAQAAGVSRQTFYRHFPGKFAAALDLFERVNGEVAPIWRAIGERDYTRREVVSQWVGELFDFYNDHGRAFRIFTELGLVEPAFMERTGKLVPEVIRDLGKTIPAFDIPWNDASASDRRWGEAWLLVYGLFDQCNTTAIGFKHLDQDLLVELIAANFHRFMTSDS